MTEREQFEGWAIIELLGHRRLGAYVREAQIAGAGMLRLDIPEHAWIDGCTCGSLRPDSLSPDDHNHHCHMFRADDDVEPHDIHATQFYSTAALYALTPTTEEMARAIRSRPEPVQQWELPRRELLPAAAFESHDQPLYAEEDDPGYIDDEIDDESM